MSKFYPLTVKKVVDETSLSKSFVLKPLHGDAKVFQYQPGQFLTFRIPLQSGQIQRSYSISSAPCFDADMMVCVKRVQSGRGSNWFNDQLKPGSTIEASMPAGRFTLDDAKVEILIIAGGSGITPCISLIKQILYETNRKVKLVYANQNSSSIIYHDVLNQLQERFVDRFECTHWLDDNHGFLGPDDILDCASSSKHASCYICGPAVLMDMAETVLDEHYSDTMMIKTERFVSADEEPPGDEISDSELNADQAFISAYQLQYEGKTHTVNLAAGQTLLDAALACDLDIPRSCTEGHCGTCIAKLLSGEVSMTSTKALSKRSIERGHILLCQARPGSDKDLIVNLDF